MTTLPIKTTTETNTGRDCQKKLAVMSQIVTYSQLRTTHGNWLSAVSESLRRTKSNLAAS